MWAELCEKSDTAYPVWLGPKIYSINGSAESRAISEEYTHLFKVMFWAAQTRLTALYKNTGGVINTHF